MNEETFRLGSDVFFAEDAPGGQHSAFFEDDGETGYFYAVDLTRPDNVILDARSDLQRPKCCGPRSSIRLVHCVVRGRVEVRTSNQQLRARWVRFCCETRLLSHKLPQLSEQI